MLTACLIAASILTSRDDPAGQAPDEAPMSLRLHPIAGLTERAGTSDAAMFLLPFATNIHAAGFDTEGEEGAPPLELDSIAELVRDLVEPGFWDEQPEARLEFVGDKQLLVVATDAMHERIEELLASLSGTLVTPQTLEVRVVGALADSDAEGALALDAAAADQRIEERGLLRHARVALRGSSVVSTESANREEVVFDWEVEIAQGATVADPVVRSIARGLFVSARAAPVEGGTLLDLLVRASEPAAGNEVRRLSATSLVNAKPVMSERRAAGIVEHPRLGFASFVGTVLVPHDRALWIPVSIATHLGTIEFVLDLRVRGPAAAPAGIFENGSRRAGGRQSLGFLAAGSMALRGVHTPRIPTEIFGLHRAWEGTEEMWGYMPGGQELEVLADLVGSIAAEPIDSAEGFVRTVRGGLLHWLPPELGDQVTGALAPLLQAEPLIVRGRILDGEDALGRFAFPATLERTCSLWSGVEGVRLADWDVDVANEAQSSNPQLEAWVDGFALRLVVSRTPLGELLADVSAEVNLLDGAPRKQNLEDAASMELELLRSRVLHVDELRTAPAQGGTIRLGGDLALELELAPMRAR